MYGTIARMRVKEGMAEKLRALGQQDEQRKPSGFVFQYVYQSDTDPQEYWLVVGFESKEAYQANANDPEQHEQYQQVRALLETDPEWHDGEIVYSV